MTQLAKLKLISILVALVIAGTIGFMWYRRDYAQQQAGDRYAGLVTYVDRNLAPEKQASLEQSVATLEASIKEFEATNQYVLDKQFQLGYYKYQLGDFAGAREAYEQIVAVEATNETVFSNLGDVLVEMGDVHAAEVFYLRAIDASPSSEELYVKLIDYWRAYLPERKDLIGPKLEEAILAGGQKQALLVLLAQWYAERGQYDEALSHYQVAMTLDPGNKSISDEYNDVLRKRAEKK